MAERIELRQVTGSGTPGELVGAVLLEAGVVTYEAVVARETFEMLARRFRRTPAQIFALVRDNGWSNGAIMAVNVQAR